MPTRFIHDGDSIDHTPGSPVAAGDVIVLGNCVAVAKRDIPANVVGALAVEGVFDFPKATGGFTALGAGVIVYWNVGAQQATATAGGNALIGKTVRAAADADGIVRVRLSYAVINIASSSSGSSSGNSSSSGAGGSSGSGSSGGNSSSSGTASSSGSSSSS